MLRLMSIHRARTLGSQETKQPDEQNISLVEFKPMDGKRPVEESAEETSADHDDHEEEEEETSKDTKSSGALETEEDMVEDMEAEGRPTVSESSSQEKPRAELAFQ